MTLLLSGSTIPLMIGKIAVSVTIITRYYSAGNTLGAGIEKFLRIKLVGNRIFAADYPSC